MSLHKICRTILPTCYIKNSETSMYIFSERSALCLCTVLSHNSRFASWGLGWPWQKQCRLWDLSNLAKSRLKLNKKQLYALVCECIKYKPVVEEIIQKVQLEQNEILLKKQPHLSLVLVYEFLFGKGLDRAPDKYKNVILRHKAALRAALARLKVKSGAVKNKDLLPHDKREPFGLPRYVRVNLLKTSVVDVMDQFQNEGYKLITRAESDYDSFLKVVKALKTRQFMRDIHLDELLIFAPNTDLHNHQRYLSGDIIFQDKASCLPAKVLNPTPGSHVIDCCAAPGNKSTHAAAIMSNKGKIFAVDKDSKRFVTMTTLTLKAGATCVQLMNDDFLSLNPEDPRFANVRYIIVDPSCSGSGIVNRMGSVTDDGFSSSSERLDSLAAFQKSVLTHALLFPKVHRVVYSTCSIHTQENEMVVKEVVEHSNGRFAVTKILPEMPSRGSGVFPESNFCVKLTPDIDLTNGFFVACLERTGKETTNDEETKSIANLNNVNDSNEILQSDQCKKNSLCIYDDTNIVSSKNASCPLLKGKRRQAVKQSSSTESSAICETNMDATSEQQPVKRSKSSTDVSKYSKRSSNGKKKKNKKRKAKPVTRL